MGIRGSNVVIEVLPNGKTRVTCNYCDRVEIQLLSDPSKLVTIFGSDRFRTIEIGPDGFSAPFELTEEEIALLQDLLTSRPGQNELRELGQHAQRIAHGRIAQVWNQHAAQRGNFTGNTG